MRFEALLEILTESKALGFLGPGDPASHIAHAVGFADTALRAAPAPRNVADLGTGGGVPGLILAEYWSTAEVVCIETAVRRARALESWIHALGFGERVRVYEGRAEDAGRDSELREHFDLVTARSFARPAVTAEIAAGLVRPGGTVVVSEPPAAEDRWPTGPLRDLGLGAAVVTEAGGAHYATLSKVAAVPAQTPRRPGIPAKRPLW
jgi:16S rRNA (guanine527-N7)-methyltransferase